MASDYGHEQTDKTLAELEKRIQDVYKQAHDELQKTVDAYFKSFWERDSKMRAQLEAGEITADYYREWRLAQIGRGERFEALRDVMAERYTQANEVAVSYVNDTTPGIYALNHNYMAYTIERVAGDIGFTLFDEQTVRRLIVEQPNLMPNYPAQKAIKRGIDLAWGKKQITASVTSGILQGHGVKQVADDLQKRIETMNRESAIRTARTALTGAENAGRLDGLGKAREKGIDVQKEWVATMDGRTRHSHRMVDGETVDQDKKFSNGLRYPGDPAGPGREVYNCRCTMIGALKGVREAEPTMRRVRNPETGEYELIEDMNYTEWEKRKKNAQKIEIVRESDTIKETPKPLQYKRFESGDEVNDFFYYDGEERGLLAKKQSQYGQWMKILTQDEKDSILDYTAGGYGDINDYFRKRGAWKEINEEKVKNASQYLDSAISKYRLKENIVVQRGVMEDALDDMISKYGDDIENFIGKVFHDDGYVSTTVLQGNAVATTKPVVFEISVPAGVGRGAYVNELSGFTDTEYEFLLRRGASYTITDAIEDIDTEKIIIKMVMNDG